MRTQRSSSLVTSTRSNHAHAVAILFLMLAALASSPWAPAQQGSSGVPDSRFNHLRHGINLSQWFAQSLTGNYDRQRLTTYVTGADFDEVKAMGFDHVRISIDPAPMFNSGQPDRIDPKYLSLLDDAVKMGLSRGLAVILDIHADSDFKQKLAHEEHQVEGFTDFWRSLAKHYSTFDPELVFFEVLNEPEMSDGYRWYGIQTQVATAIRSVAPRHTIVVTGHKWSADDELVQMEPLADRNVIYNFHFYNPHTFTHQGAIWGSEIWHHLPRVHYPSHPGADAELMNTLPMSIQRLEISRYDQDRWGPERIESEIAQVADWAAKRNVRVTCNEFGVYRAFADPDERAAWIRDVRSSLEKHNIGWTMWDYAGNFAVAPGAEPGHRPPDERVLKTLGLR